MSIRPQWQHEPVVSNTTNCCTHRDTSLPQLRVHESSSETVVEEQAVKQEPHVLDAAPKSRPMEAKDAAKSSPSAGDSDCCSLTDTRLPELSAHALSEELVVEKTQKKEPLVETARESPLQASSSPKLRPEIFPLNTSVAKGGKPKCSLSRTVRKARNAWHPKALHNSHQRLNVASLQDTP